MYSFGSSFRAGQHALARSSSKYTSLTTSWMYVGFITLLGHISQSLEQRYMFEMIENRRKAEKKEERSDLFSSLMDAAAEDSLGSSRRITDRELVGNTFIFLYVSPYSS